MTTHTPESVRTALYDAIASVAPEIDLTAIRPDRAFRDQAELDSFDFLRVLTRLHEQLGVDVPETDYGEFATLDRAVAYVIQRLGTSVGS